MKKNRKIIEDIKDFLTEYEDQKMRIYIYVMPYFLNFCLYRYSYLNNKVLEDQFYGNYSELYTIVKTYKENNISLDKFVYYINIDDNRELTIKFVERLKQIYPNINTDISNHDVGWHLKQSKYKLNIDSDGIYFILN